MATTWITDFTTEFEIAITGWKDELQSALQPRGIRDFLPSSTLPFFAPIVRRGLDALQALPNYIRAGLGAFIAGLVLDARIDPKLHQRVIPLDLVAKVIGRDFVRGLLSFDDANAPREIKRPLDTLRRLVSRTFDPKKFLRSKVLGAASLILATAINIILTAGAVFASVAVADQLLKSQRSLEAQALGQTKKRRRLKIKMLARVPR